MDFTLAPDVDSFRLRVRDFVASHVLPLETEADTWGEGENIRDSVLKPLRAKAREAGLWCPQMPRERGGQGFGGGIGGAEMDPDARATAMAERDGARGAGFGINSVLLDGIIEFLEAKVQ